MRFISSSIHARIFQELFPWAGQFRAPESSSSLDTLFDRLARENRLKGLDPDVWSKRSTEYFTEIAAIEPFIGGTDLASLEFFRELASENNLTLRWTNAMSEPSRDEMQSHLQQAQSNNSPTHSHARSRSIPIYRAAEPRPGSAESTGAHRVS